jgi:O-acetyl-ADP-ribose deacetylase (regulator of RNase III)
MITLVQGDITREEVDAIVNAANSGLRGGGGVDGAIHGAAGPSVMEECRKIGGCPSGCAVATGAGKLKAKKILHAVGPMWGGGKNGEPEQLEDCYRACFRLCHELGLRTMALPAISTGAYGYPREDACRIALRVGLDHEGDLDEIRYVCFTDADLALYERTLVELRA